MDSVHNDHMGDFPNMQYVPVPFLLLANGRDVDVWRLDCRGTTEQVTQTPRPT